MGLTTRQQQEAMNLILGLNGRMFSAAFIKADGTLRTGTFMAHYTWDGTSGNPKLGRTYAREMHGIIKAVDMNVARERGKAAAIRSIKMERLVALRIDGRLIAPDEL